MPYAPLESPEVKLAKQKAIMRAHYRRVRKSLSAESRSLLDSALFANTVVHPLFQASELILCYYPTMGEPNILPILRHAIKLGKRVAFPISDTETNTLTFRLVADLSDLRPGAYDIPEPPSYLPALTDTHGALCIVPGLVFDRFGYRLGYGKGYYDRFLATFQGKTMGPVYSDCLVDLVPREETDRRVDLIITEKGEVLPDEPFS